MHLANPADSDVFSADLSSFDHLVVAGSHTRPVLVDFWADWCAPCHAIAPQLQRALSELAGRVSLCKVEVDAGENMKLAGHYRLRGFPTIMLFVDGEERGRFAGNRAGHWIRDWVLEHLDST